MDIILNILLPVFGIAGLGYVASRAGWFSESAETGVSKFVFNFAVPFMLFRTIAATDLPDTVPWGLFGSYYLPAFFVYATGALVARFAFGRDGMGSILTGLGCAFSNTVLLALPILLLAYGEEGTLPFFLILSVHGLMLFSGTTILLEWARSEGKNPFEMGQQILTGLVQNPIILGLAAGLTANLSGWALPEPMERISLTFQGAVLPCALFVLGASLSRYGIAGRLTQSFFLLFLKLIAFPALVYILGSHVFVIDPHWVKVATLTAAQPAGVMVFIFATKYGTAQALATTTIFLSTIVSFFTSWAILWIFEGGSL